MAEGAGLGVSLDPGEMAVLFGEDQARYLVACSFDQAEALMTAAARAGVQLAACRPLRRRQRPAGHQRGAAGRTVGPLPQAPLRVRSATLDCAPGTTTFLPEHRGRPMAITAEELETLLRDSFPKGQVTITDLAGDGNHYAAEIIDESFRGLNRVQQQRAVYAALKGKMDGSQGELHALALTTKAPE
jgi:stress-induced morphogen